MPKAKVNGVEVAGGGLHRQLPVQQGVRAGRRPVRGGGRSVGRLLPLALGFLVSACDNEVEVTTQANAPMESDRVRVCRAATSHFNQPEPVGARTVRQDSVDRVELSYAAAPTGVGMLVECAFQGDQVTWRPVAVSVPSAGVTDAAAQRRPESLTYRVDEDTVRLSQRKTDGSWTEITWTSRGTGGATTETTRSSQGRRGSTNANASTEAE